MTKKKLEARKTPLPPLSDKAYYNMFKAIKPLTGFSFRKPRNSIEFTPQQKGAIRKKWIEYGSTFMALKKDKKTFIPYKKDSSGRRNLYKGVTGTRTAMGIVLNLPNAKIVETKKITGDRKKVFLVESKASNGEISRAFYFPDFILGNIDLIEDYILELERIYKPDSVKTLINNSVAQKERNPKQYLKYVTAGMTNKKDERKNAQPEYMDGVLFTFFENKNQFTKADKKEQKRIKKLNEVKNKND